MTNNENKKEVSIPFKLLVIFGSFGLASFGIYIVYCLSSTVGTALLLYSIYYLYNRVMEELQMNRTEAAANRIFQRSPEIANTTIVKLTEQELFDKYGPKVS